jgi:hypothetical protein
MRIRTNDYKDQRALNLTSDLQCQHISQHQDSVQLSFLGFWREETKNFLAFPSFDEELTTYSSEMKAKTPLFVRSQGILEDGMQQ